MCDILIPVITLWQPWANAVCTPHPDYPWRGVKEYETRHWLTDMRGRVLIHAAKKMDKEIKKHLFRIWANAPYTAKMVRDALPEGGSLPVQCIVGTASIESCVTSDAALTTKFSFSNTPNDEQVWGDWEPGRFGWHLAQPVLFDNPIPWKGAQTPFTKVPINVLDEKYHYLFDITEMFDKMMLVARNAGQSLDTKEGRIALLTGYMPTLRKYVPEVKTYNGYLHYEESRGEFIDNKVRSQHDWADKIYAIFTHFMIKYSVAKSLDEQKLALGYCLPMLVDAWDCKI